MKNNKKGIGELFANIAMTVVILFTIVLAIAFFSFAANKFQDKVFKMEFAANELEVNTDIINFLRTPLDMPFEGKTFGDIIIEYHLSERNDKEILLQKIGYFFKKNIEKFYLEKYDEDIVLFTVQDKDGTYILRDGDFEYVDYIISPSLSTSVKTTRYRNVENADYVGVAFLPVPLFNDILQVRLFIGDGGKAAELGNINFDEPLVISAEEPSRLDISHDRLNGLDVSYHQRNIDWPLVAEAGYKFVFIKSTEGRTYQDPDYSINLYGAENAGLYVGCYHFAWPVEPLLEDARAEANDFLTRSANCLKSTNLIPVLDLEKNEKVAIQYGELETDKMSIWVNEWMRVVEQAIGKKPLLYGSSYVKGHVDQTVINKYPLWIAHWRNPEYTQPTLGKWNNWVFWQYTDKGKVPGINMPPCTRCDGGVDLDLFQGDEERLKQYLIGYDGSISDFVGSGLTSSTVKDAVNVPNINFDYLSKLDKMTGNFRKSFTYIVLHDGGEWSWAKEDGDKAAQSVINLWLGDHPASSHYFINYDGTIYQFVSEELVAYHAACTKEKYGDGCKMDAMNSNSIGIDLRNDYQGELPYRDEQMYALNNLLRDISQRRGIPLDDDHVVGHLEVLPVGKSDPVKGFKWDMVAGLTKDHSKNPKQEFNEVIT